MKIEVVAQEPEFVPFVATSGSSGADIMAYLPENPMVIEPNKIGVVPTGLKFKIPKHHGMLILPRSGRSKNHERIANSPGLLDSDYRGELKILLHNQSGLPITLKHGERIAQIIVIHTPEMEFVATNFLSADEDNERGEGGFGSTGVEILG